MKLLHLITLAFAIVAASCTFTLPPTTIEIVAGDGTVIIEIPEETLTFEIQVAHAWAVGFEEIHDLRFARRGDGVLCILASDEATFYVPSEP